MLLTISRISPNAVITVGGAVGVLRMGVSRIAVEITTNELEAVRGRLVELQSAGLISFSTSPADTSAGGGNAVVATMTASGAIADFDQILPIDTTLGAISAALPATTVPGRQVLLLRVNTSGTNGIIATRAPGVKINGSDSNLILPGSNLAQVNRWHAMYLSATLGWMVG